jgi:hypothetical protein
MRLAAVLGIWKWAWLSRRSCFLRLVRFRVGVLRWGDRSAVQIALGRITTWLSIQTDVAARRTGDDVLSCRR